jgi:hypothetical protein
MVSQPQWTAFVAVAFLVTACCLIVIDDESTRADERTRLPRSGQARPPVVSPKRELLLSVTLPSQGNDRPPAEPVVTIAGEEVASDRLRAELERARGEGSARSRAARRDDISVVIRADAKVPAGFIQRLVQTCQDVGFTRFALKPLEGE